MDKNRGTGRTTRQISEAPRGAVFVARSWQSAVACQQLAIGLGRNDMRFVDKDYVTAGMHRGLSSTLVFDHACEGRSNAA